MKTIVYIDGFNLYYRLLEKRPPLKWVNPLELVKQALDPVHIIIKVRYFTARVSGRRDPDAPRRQQLYLDALSSVPEIEVHFGTFLEKRKYASLVRPKLDRSDRENVPTFLPWPDVVRVWKTEEKGSDVALANHLLMDGFKGAYEAAAVLSNDSDLIEPIRMARTELKLPIGLLSPVRFPTPDLKAAASFLRHVKPVHLSAAQFPDPVRLANGSLVPKPASWA